MGRPGDTAHSSPLTWSRNASSPPQSSSDHSRASSSADGDHSFFGKRPQRSSGHSGSSLGSPATSPISPLTTITQHNIKEAERQSLIRSEATLNIQARSQAITSAPDLQYASSDAIPKLPDLHQSRPSQTSRTSYSSSLAASIGAGKAPKLPILRVPSKATKDGQPPRQAKYGHKWKEESSGHWLEIRLRRRPRLDSRHAVSEENTPSVHSTTSPKPLDETLPSDQPPGSATNSSKAATIVNEEGLYCRTKRRLGLKKGLVDSVQDEGVSKSPTGTGQMLDEASDTLREYAEKMTKYGDASSVTTTNVSIAGTRSGLSRLFSSYRKITHSTTSSVRNVLMGKAPMPSPDPEAMYEGPNNNSYFRTDISDPDGSTFLPSEARRVDTPPLARGKRGFFFDCSKSPSTNNSSPESEGTHSPPVTPGGTSKKRRGSDIDWYKMKEAADEARDERLNMELNVPEHLPSSPLCPRNPKHKSEGTGVCVYHGRNGPSS